MASSSREINVLLVGPRRSGKTTLAGLMGHPRFNGVPEGLRLRASGIRDALKRVKRLEDAVNRAAPWSPIDVDSIITRTPADRLFRYTYTLECPATAPPAAKFLDLITIHMLDIGGLTFEEGPERVREVLGRDGMSLHDVDIVMFVVDAVALVEAFGVAREKAMAVDSVSAVISKVLELKEIPWIFAVLTRCETYLLEGKDHRQRLAEARDWWAERVGLRRLIPASVEVLFQCWWIPVFTTGCLRVRKAEIAKGDGGDGNGGADLRPIFERTERSFAPRFTAAVYGIVLKVAIEIARERRGGVGNVPGLVFASPQAPIEGSPRFRRGN